MNVYFKLSVEILYGRSTLNVKNIRQGLDLLLPDNRKTKKKWIYLMMAWHSMDFLISIQRDNSQELVSSILELQGTYPFFTNAAAAHSEVNDLKGGKAQKR